ncbi:cell division protein CrgA [Sphingomonas sp. LR61]
MASDKDRTKPARRTRADSVDTAGDAPNPVWFKPVMFGFMLIGLVWVIVFYISNATLPVPSLARGTSWSASASCSSASS